MSVYIYIYIYIYIPLLQDSKTGRRAAEAPKENKLFKRGNNRT